MGEEQKLILWKNATRLLKLELPYSAVIGQKHRHLPSHPS